MSSEYHFVTVWRVPGTIEEVKDVLGNADTLPQWWPSVYLSVRRVSEGGPDFVGSENELHTKGWLPYTLRWTLTLTEPMTDTGFALEASGDLNGTGVWTFEQDGPEVVITYDWRVQAGQAPAAPAGLAPQARLRGQPPLGHGQGRGEPAARDAPPPGDVRGGAAAGPAAAARHLPPPPPRSLGA